MGDESRHAALDILRSLVHSAAAHAGRAASAVRSAAGGGLVVVERELIRRLGLRPDAAHSTAAGLMLLSFAVGTAAMGYGVSRFRGAQTDDGSAKGSLKGRPLVEVDLLPEYFAAGLLAELPYDLLSRLLLAPRRGDPIWPAVPYAPPVHPSGTVLITLSDRSAPSRDRDRSVGRPQASTKTYALRSPLPLTNVVHR